MKAAEIETGGIYTAKVSGHIVQVRVEGFRIRWKPKSGSAIYGREWTEWVCTSLKTGRQIIVKSCQRFSQPDKSGARGW